MIDETEALYADGGYFLRCSASQALGYEPPITYSEYAHVVETLARLAGEGDAGAAIASRLVASVNLYGSPSQVRRSLYTTAYEFVRDGYDDVLGRTGPEAGRPSDHRHAVSLRFVLLISNYLGEATLPISGGAPFTKGPGGWIAKALCERHGVPFADRRRFPRSTRGLAD